MTVTLGSKENVFEARNHVAMAVIERGHGQVPQGVVQGPEQRWNTGLRACWRFDGLQLTFYRSHDHCVQLGKEWFGIRGARSEVLHDLKHLAAQLCRGCLQCELLARSGRDHNRVDMIPPH